MIFQSYRLDGGFVATDSEQAERALQRARQAMEDAGVQGIFLDAVLVEDTERTDRRSLLAAWEGSLTRQQRIVLHALREQRRDDPTRREEYRLIGEDARGRPVCQKPARYSARDGGAQVTRWAVLRNGDPTDVSEPVRPLDDVLDAFAAAAADAAGR